MSVLVDTGVFYAHQDQDDKGHRAAKRALEVVLAGGMGHAFTTDYIFDETLTLTLQRTKSHAQMMTVARRILGTAPHPRTFDVLMVTGTVFRDALHIIERYQDRRLSFTDATSVAMMHRRGIDAVLSFDRGFDGIVPRRNPADL